LPAASCALSLTQDLGFLAFLFVARHLDQACPLVVLAVRVLCLFICLLPVPLQRAWK